MSVDTPLAVSRLARQLYPGSDLKSRMQVFRPYICPFHLLLRFVPRHSSVLDIGCGAGLFLGLLNATDRIGLGVGFDASSAAIRAACDMAQRSAATGALRFERIDAAEPWPDGHFDVVSMIDVMHHVPVAMQSRIVEMVADRIEIGGTFLYKDMVERPRWRAWANRLHDLLLAGERINYAPIETVINQAKRCGLTLRTFEEVNMLWYGHQLCVFERTAL